MHARISHDCMRPLLSLSLAVSKLHYLYDIPYIWWSIYCTVSIVHQTRASVTLALHFTFVMFLFRMPQ